MKKNNTKSLQTIHFRWMKIRTFLFAVLIQTGANEVLAANGLSASSRGNMAITAPVQSTVSISVWDILGMTSWLFWPFICLTVFGTVLISLKVLQEYQQKVRAGALLKKKISAGDLQSLGQIIQAVKSNRASKLYFTMLAAFNKTRMLDLATENKNSFINNERESFETFNRVISFLSDTAGALGLLGTVWGIFVTFHGGIIDGPTILKGMSVSLVTTLVGLIISVYLNAGATAVFALFNNQMDTLGQRADELAHALLQISGKRQVQGTAKSAGATATGAADAIQVSIARKQNTALQTAHNRNQSFPERELTVLSEESLAALP